MNTLRPLDSRDEELMRRKANLSLRLNTRIESGRHPLKPGSSGCMQAMQRGSKKATGRLRTASNFLVETSPRLISCGLSVTGSATRRMDTGS